jgi:hypothetical protein
LRLKSTLARGKKLGSALLVLEGTHQLVTGTASVDNRMPASLGTWTYGTSVALNSALGFGEQFYGSAQTGGDLRQSFDPASPFRVLGVGAVLLQCPRQWRLQVYRSVFRHRPGGVDLHGSRNIVESQSIQPCRFNRRQFRLL